MIVFLVSPSVDLRLVIFDKYGIDLIFIVLKPESSFLCEIKSGTDLMNQNSRIFDDEWHESVQLPNTI